LVLVKPQAVRAQVGSRDVNTHGGSSDNYSTFTPYCVTSINNLGSNTRKAPVLIANSTTTVAVFVQRMTTGVLEPFILLLRENGRRNPPFP
jgi:hypothetical protein